MGGVNQCTAYILYLEKVIWISSFAGENAAFSGPAIQPASLIQSHSICELQVRGTCPCRSLTQNGCFIILALRTGYTFPQQAGPASSQQLICLINHGTLIARLGCDGKELLFSCKGGETPKLKRGWVLLSEPMGPAGRWGALLGASGRGTWFHNDKYIQVQKLECLEAQSECLVAEN